MNNTELIAQREQVNRLIKRCQTGVGGREALNEAHSIMAECYGVLGKLMSQVEAADALEAAQPEFQIALLKELAEVKQTLLATQGQLGTAKRMCAQAQKTVEEWEPAPQVPMTDDQIKELSEAIWGSELDYQHTWEIEFARAIEAHHKIGVKP